MLFHCGFQRDDLDFLAHFQTKLYQSQLGHLLATPTAQTVKFLLLCVSLLLGLWTGKPSVLE